MDEVVEQITANARRLLSDAKLLRTHGSFQSAVSLSILSLEESGKACLVRWKRAKLIERDISRDLYVGHINKQRIVGAYLFCRAVANVVHESGGRVPIESDIPDDLVERAAKAGYENGHKIITFAEIGALDFVKMAGFYVDLDPNLEILSRGLAMKVEDATKHIQDAELGIEMATASDVLHRMMAAVYELQIQRKLSRPTHEQFAVVWQNLSQDCSSTSK